MQEKVGSISRSSSIKYVPNSPDQLGNCSILPPIFTHSKKKGFNPVKYFNRGVSAAESWKCSTRWGCNLPYHVCNSIEQDRQKLSPEGAGPTCLIVGSIPMMGKLFLSAKINESQVLWKSYLRVQFLRWSGSHKKLKNCAGKIFAIALDFLSYKMNSIPADK